VVDLHFESQLIHITRVQVSQLNVLILYIYTHENNYTIQPIQLELSRVPLIYVLLIYLYLILLLYHIP
jgi:hypothetical protein